MKRLLCALIALALALGAPSAFASDVTMAQRFAGAIVELEEYLKAGVEDEVALGNCQALFYEIGGAYGNLLGSYTSALLYVIQGKYNMALRFAAIAANDADFNQYINAEIDSPYIQDGVKLNTYVLARQAEAANQGEEARALYETCYGFFDARLRADALLLKHCERLYAEGLAALEREDYTMARALF